MCRRHVELSVDGPARSGPTPPNGSVDLTSLAGDVVATTDNGRITGDDLTGHTYELTTDNGRIEVAFETAPTEVRAQTDNGSIDVTAPAAEYHVTTTTDNGSATNDLGSTPGADHTMTLTAQNGSITVGS